MKYPIFFLLAFFWLTACQRDDQGGELELSIPVSISEIKPASIEEFISGTATVNATKNASLRSEIEGNYYLATNPATGKPYAPADFVKKGTVIIRFDNPEFENNIAIESIKLNLDISSREFEKQQSLFDKGGVTLRELKNAERSLIDARYAHQNGLLQLQKLTVSAPFAGIIVDLPYYTSGTKVAANQLMVQMMDYSKLYAEVNYPSRELNRIKIGQELRVTHHSVLRDTLYGKISQVSPALDPQTRSFEATVLVDNPGYILRPGMFVKIETIVARHDSVIVIQKDILLSKRRGKTVYVVDKGAAFERVIGTGLENEYALEVIEGLKFGEQLVVKGFETLRNRSKVKIVR